MVEVEQRRYADYITLQELESLRAENAQLNLRIERVESAINYILSARQKGITKDVEGVLREAIQQKDSE